MRLKLDENLSGELTRLFVEAGHDAVTILDQEIGGASDAIVASAGQPDPRPCAGNWYRTPPNIVEGSASRSAMDRGRVQGPYKRLTQ